jgi:hypothetical protein
MVIEIACTSDLMRRLGYGIDSVSEDVPGGKAIEYKEHIDDVTFGGVKTETGLTLCSYPVPVSYILLFFLPL